MWQYTLKECVQKLVLFHVNSTKMSLKQKINLFFHSDACEMVPCLLYSAVSNRNSKVIAKVVKDDLSGNF